MTTIQTAINQGETDPVAIDITIASDSLTAEPLADDELADLAERYAEAVEEAVENAYPAAEITVRLDDGLSGITVEPDDHGIELHVQHIMERLHGEIS